MVTIRLKFLILFVVISTWSSVGFSKSCSSFLSHNGVNRSILNRFVGDFQNSSLIELSALLPESVELADVAHKYSEDFYTQLTIDDLPSFNVHKIKRRFKKRRFITIRGLERGLINKGTYTLNYGDKKYFLKMLSKDYLIQSEEALRVQELNIIQEVRYLKLLSDLGWGAKFYGVVEHRGYIVGVITEKVPGRLSRDINRHEVTLTKRRKMILRQLGIDTFDFQFMFDYITNRSWIIDTGFWLPLESKPLVSTSEESILRLLEQGYD